MTIRCRRIRINDSEHLYDARPIDHCSCYSVAIYDILKQMSQKFAEYESC